VRVTVDGASPIGWARRIAYAFIGLLAGNAAIVAYFLITAVWALLRFHALPSKPPASHILIGYAGLILIYGTFSFLGWLIVGLPVVVLLPVGMLNRLPWLVILLIAATIGVAAYFPIFLLFSGGHPTLDLFRREGPYWLLALLASTVGFPTYCWLIRRRTVTCNP
jgi:hypothetical protein